MNRLFKYGTKIQNAFESIFKGIENMYISLLKVALAKCY